MICNGQCADGATQSGLARAGLARAIACAVVLVLGGLDVVPAWASTVSNVTISSTPTNNTYAVDDDINVDVVFAAVVHVDQTESCPNDPKQLTLVLNIGEQPRHARFIEGSGNSDMTLHFRYTVQYGDDDDDGISIGPGVRWLQGACIVTATNAGVSRAFDGLPANSSHKVDGISPMPVAMDPVKIISSPYQGDTYGLGEDIEVTVTFDETVHVDETDTELGLVLSIGQHSRRATFVGGSGSETLTFRYTVQTGDDDKVDGISIGAGPGSLIGARIEDFAGNLVVRTFPGVAADDGHKVDGIKPTLREVRIASTPVANETYGLNEEIEVEVTFGEDVHVREAGELELIIAIGQHSRAAAFVDGSGTPELMFRYVVQSDDDDDDGISIGPNALRGGIIEDAAGNPVDRTFAGRPAAREHKVDGATTAQSSVRIVSTPVGNGTYRLDEEITLDVDFGEDVSVDEMDSELVLVLSIGQQSRAARFVGGSGTDTLTFRYVVQSDDYDDDGISIDPNALQGGSILDAQNTPVDRTSARLAADPGHKVDGSTTALKAVRIVSTPDSGPVYGLNEEIRVAVDFGEEVHVTSTGGDLTLVLSIGEHLRDATLADGSGTETLTFRYVVQSEDYDDDGISIGPNALQGGVVEDAAGNPVERAFAGLEANSRHRVDGVSPAVTSVRFDSRPGADGIYGLGDEIKADVEFDEDVHVTNTAGDLALLLAIGEHSREATFVGGSGTDILTFRYVVQSEDYDDDGISIGPNALRGGVIEDGAGNAVDRTFAGLAADPGQTVDGRVDRVIPAILRVAIASDAGSNDTYTTDDIIRVDVGFNVPVYVTGAPPVLELAIGPALRDALFVEGSGTPTLKFEYTVEAGDTDTDGISIAANSLTGGITDANGNAVDLTFEAVPRSVSHKVSAELLLFPLSLTLIVGQSHTFDLLEELERLGVEYVGEFEWSSDDATVATATLSAGSMLTITSVAEGTARIAVAATDAAIFLFFGITVETSAAETAVLEDAMAAVGRGLLASAGSTIGERLEMTDASSSDDWGGRGVAPVTAAASSQWSVLDGGDYWGSPLGYGRWGMDDPYLQGSMGYTPAQWLRGARFEMPLRGFGNPVSSWAVWGAGDWHAFEGEGDDGLYDGSLTSAYLGVDARGDGWVAGASVSRAMADASYEYGGAVGGKGRLETELNVIHPYVQWAFRDRGKMWAILGFGTGEATAERDDQEGAREPGELSMRMGLGGIRYSFGPFVGFDLAVRGDAGFAQLETDEGPRAIQGLAVDVQRLRIGAEASLPMALRGVPVSPFINVAARFDGGDGATGGGVELAGGFRYQGSAVSLEVKGRTLAMHADESYSEEGVKATLVVGPDSRKGFRLLLSPRWGGAAEAMDIFRYQGHPFASALRRENRGWGLGSRVSYGFDMWHRPGTIMPFGEVDLSREAYRRARVGVSYELASAILGVPHRLEIAGESAESDTHGTILQFLLTGQAHF